MRIEKSFISLMIGSIILGIGPVLIRLSEVGALATGFWRFAAALPILSVWALLAKSREHTIATFRDYVILIMIGGVLGVYIALWNLSLDYTTIAISTILINIAPLLLVVWYWILGNRPSLKLLIGLGCAFVGVLLLAQPRFKMEQAALYGILLASVSAVLYAAYISMISQMRQRVSTASAMLFPTFGAFLSMSFILAIFHEPWAITTWSGALIVLILAGGVHVFGQGLVLYAIARMPLMQSAPLLLIQPLIAVLLGVWFLGESLDFLQILGIAAAFSGLYIIAIEK